MEPPLEYAGALPSGRLVRTRRGIVPWLSLGGTVLIWIIPFGMLVGVLSICSGIVLAPVLAALMVYLGYRAVMDARRRNGQIIVDYFDLAVRLNLPLVPFLRAAERSETGARARQIMKVRLRLESGESLADALADARDVPDEVIGRLLAAEAIGQVRPALAQSVREARRAADEAVDTPDRALLPIYVVFMLFATSTLITGLMIFVVPKFREIFRDFRTTLPPLTEFVIGVSNFVADDWGIVTALVILAILGLALLLLSVCATRVFLPAMPLPDFRRWLAWMAWRLPIAHTLQRDRGMAETCALLAAATRAGSSLPAALVHAGSLPVNRAFRIQLEHFRQRLLAGDTPADAADTAGLPQLMSGLLAPTSTQAPDCELFNFLERYYRNRFSRTHALLRSALGPILVLTIGTLVGTTVVSLFLPLVKLIGTVAGAGDGGAL